MYAHSVQIGPEFFRKAFDDYSDRYWAFVREILQNSLDCGSLSIRIVVEYHPDDHVTMVIVNNDGAPMDDEILVNKLLSLGSSGKDFQEGCVGGFGKAKEILYFAHKAYSIRSGDWLVTGSGAGYNLARQDDHQAGTISAVAWEGDRVFELLEAFRNFIDLCPVESKVEMVLNGERLKGKIRAGDVERSISEGGESWADIRLSKSRVGKYLVRIGGIPMFTGNCDYRGLVILDLHGTSASKMTSNRDGLKFPFNCRFSDFLTTIAVDRTTAFKLEKAEYRRYAGPKLNQRAEAGTPVLVGVAAHSDPRVDMAGAGILVRVTGRTDNHPSILSHAFVVKNCVRRAVPAEFDPDSLQFSNYAHWVVKAWAGCLVELHEMYENRTPFTTGFIFAEDCEAEYEASYNEGVTYYINPAIVGKKRTTRRYKRDSRHQILASAVHEFVHGHRMESYHGEEFANQLTDMMGVVMKNMKRFHRHLN